jgi:hypothetical protein
MQRCAFGSKVGAFRPSQRNAANTGSNYQHRKRQAIRAAAAAPDMREVGPHLTHLHP